MGNCCSTPEDDGGDIQEGGVRRPDEQSPLIRKTPQNAISSAVPAQPQPPASYQSTATSANEHYKRVVERVSSNLINVQSMSTAPLSAQDHAQRTAAYERSANVAGDTARLFELPAQSKQFRAPVAERLAAPVSSAAEIAAVRAHAEALCKSVAGMEVKPVGDLVVAMPFS